MVHPRVFSDDGRSLKVLTVVLFHPRCFTTWEFGRQKIEATGEPIRPFS